MGTKIFELLPKKEIDFKFLSGKTLAIDAFLQLYQFLSTIRQRDGSLLTDSSGNITSHLNGLFTRSSNLLKKNIKLIYVFDGKPPELKKQEQLKRKQRKLEAEKKYKAAFESKNLELMKKYASRTSRLTPEMVNEAKKLLEAMGIPCIQAPSEGEAQAAHLVKKNDAYALATQDADAFLFGTIRLVKNLTISGKRKKVGRLAYSSPKLELFELSEILNKLSIDQNQLIALGMLVGTDYNIGGIKGIGPKKALNLLKKHGSDLDALFEEIKWDESFEMSWTDIFYTIKKMPVTDDYSIKWKSLNPDKVKEILCEKHDFTEERVNTTLKGLVKEVKNKSQNNLDKWF